MTIVVSIDGALVAPERATVSVFDRGVLYGDGLFEVLRTVGGRAVDLGPHVDRLYASAEALSLYPLPRQMLAGAVEDAISAWLRAVGGGKVRGTPPHPMPAFLVPPPPPAGAALPPPEAPSPDARVRILVTRGPGALAAPLAALRGGRTIIIVEPLGPLPASVTLAIVDHPLPRRATPAHKLLAYFDHIHARELARAAGADEAVRLSADGDAVEGATSNLFVVAADGAIATPPAAGILPGITRARVLAEHPDIAIRPIPVAELRAAAEIFITSSLRGVVPVTALDGIATPHGARGPVAARIAARYSLCIFASLDG